MASLPPPLFPHLLCPKCCRRELTPEGWLEITESEYRTRLPRSSSRYCPDCLAAFALEVEGRRLRRVAPASLASVTDKEAA